MKEHVLSINNFGVPKVLLYKDAICTLIIRLLLLTPGGMQSRPGMGVGIIAKWRYMDMEKITNLQQEITEQMALYLPSLQGVDVQLEVNKDNKELIIKISVNSTLYILETDLINNNIKLINI